MQTPNPFLKVAETIRVAQRKALKAFERRAATGAAEHGSGADVGEHVPNAHFDPFSK